MDPTRRLYFEDPYLKSFEASIVGRSNAGKTWRIALDRTAFYPEGGGQPSDRGTLNDVPVTDVQTVDGIVWHEVDTQIPTDEVHGTIDWTRRFDHMQQHHGQHLLSAAFENLYAISTTSFHLGEKSVTIDLDTDELSALQIRAAEAAANEIVWANRRVDARFVTPDELETIPLRKPPTVTRDIRIVSVSGFDHSACGGTHPGRTGSVGIIVVLGTERRGQETRLEFACGGRALRTCRRRNDQIHQLARELTVGVDEVNETVLRIRDAEVKNRKQLTTIQRSMVDLEAASLVAAGVTFSGGTLVAQTFDQRPGNELQDLARAVAERGSFAILASSGSPGQVVMARPESHTIDCAALLKEALERRNGRGGGRPALARGGIPNENIEDAMKTMRGLLERAARV